jgi:TolB protein
MHLLVKSVKKYTQVFIIFMSAVLSCCNLGGGDEKRDDNAYKVNINLNGSLQNPAWSPDGKFLLFTRFRNGYNEEPADLYIINLQTSELTQLVTDGSGNVNLPGSVWDSAGDIVFSSSRDPHDEIFIIAADGGPGDEHQLTQRGTDQAYEPSFSPNGDYIVFESHVVNVEGDGKIVKKDLGQPINAGFTDMTDPDPSADGDCRQPNWSPAGDLILYQRFSGGKWDIWVMNAADGGDKTRVTTAPGDNTDAGFSQDGTQIVYSADNGELEHANLFIIPVGGGVPERITFNDGGYDGAPSWSPDGTKVAFESCGGDPDGSSGTTIWIIEIE